MIKLKTWRRKYLGRKLKNVLVKLSWVLKGIFMLRHITIITDQESYLQMYLLEYLVAVFKALRNLMFKVIRWQKESKVKLVTKAKGKVKSSKNIWHRWSGEKSGRQQSWKSGGVKQYGCRPMDKHFGSLSGKTLWSLQSCGARSNKIYPKI